MTRPRRYYDPPVEGLVASATVDTVALTQAIVTTVELSMDPRAGSLGVRGALNAMAHKLRDQLRDLLGESFDAGSDALRDASASLTAVNRELAAAKQELDRAAGCIEGLGKLAAALDKLLSTVGALAV